MNTEWDRKWSEAKDNTNSYGELVTLSETDYRGADWDPDAAQTTSRCIPEPCHDWTEYSQYAIIGGRALAIFWMFSPDQIDAAGDDESNLPFDLEHVDRVETRGDHSGQTANTKVDAPSRAAAERR